MKLRLPRRRLWRAAIYLGSLLLIALAIDLILVETRRTIHPGYETTRIAGPTLPDGSIDYLKAIEDRFSQGVTKQNNAVPLLLQAFGRTALPSNQPSDGITNRLGMPHLSTLGDYFVTYNRFDTTPNVVATITPDLYDPAVPIRWPLSPSPKTAEWIKANERPLAVIERATEKPRFFFPFYGGYHPQTLVEILLPYLSPARYAATALLIRGATRLDSGDGDGCLHDLMAVHRLARLVGQAPTLIERIVASTMETAACRTDRAVAASGKLSADQLRRFADELAALPDMPPAADGVDIAERFMFLDVAQTAARIGPAPAARLFADISGKGFVPPMIFRFVPFSYESAMRDANHWYDGMLAALRQPTYRDRSDALQRWNASFAAMYAHHALSEAFSDRFLLGLLLPAVDRACQRQEIAREQRRLTRLALALATFKSDRGSYPALLDELAPKYIRELPVDLFSDEPPIYAPTPAGYTLYSVGPNLADDKATGDDIVASVP